jgi:class 3 adenylate cyclase
VAAAVDAQRALRDHAWPDGRALAVRIGVHTGEPHVGEEGYLGLDVVRAARISAAGHGGQILISETTRALLGNQLPDGVAVHDLGEQHLKDVQHEHIYELTIDGRGVSPRPLKTDEPKSREEDIAKKFEDRITAFVQDKLERAFEESGPWGSQRE